MFGRRQEIDKCIEKISRIDDQEDGQIGHGRLKKK